MAKAKFDPNLAIPVDPHRKFLVTGGNGFIVSQDATG